MSVLIPEQPLPEARPNNNAESSTLNLLQLVDCQSIHANHHNQVPCGVHNNYQDGRSRRCIVVDSLREMTPGRCLSTVTSDPLRKPNSVRSAGKLCTFPGVLIAQYSMRATKRGEINSPCPIIMRSFVI